MSETQREHVMTEGTLNQLSINLGCARKDILVALAALLDLHAYYAIEYEDVRRHLYEAATALRAAHELQNAADRRSGEDFS